MEEGNCLSELGTSQDMSVPQVAYDIPPNPYSVACQNHLLHLLSEFEKKKGAEVKGQRTSVVS